MFLFICYSIRRYAVVRKEPPPRPPAPTRKRGSTRSLGDRQFATMPHLRKEPESNEKHSSPLPERPIRNYSTIGPTRPPRRVSVTSLGDGQRLYFYLIEKNVPENFSYYLTGRHQ